ncbi:MAG: TetR family transcriptional regulator [Actinomycetia bacterium]|nr:TetR family transcriptional regulator [Actinomycetes bacterium]
MYHSVVQRRWGGDRPTDAKERLVDAAEACFDRLGLARTTIDDVAREAHVSRATVYRHVRDRDELVLAVFAREADRFLERMTSAGARSILDGIVFAVRQVPAQPRLMEILRAAPLGAWDVGMERALARLGPQLGGDAEAVEWVLRTVLSLLTIPVEHSDDELRAFLERFLLAGLPVAVRR